MNDCTELANRTLSSIFDPQHGDFSKNMKELDKSLSERERNQPALINGNRIALEQQVIQRLAKGQDLTDLKERLMPKGQLKPVASDTAEQPAPPR